MTRVKVPQGEIIKYGYVEGGGVERLTPLTGNRSTRYRFELLDDTGRKFGDLDGVTSGSVEWNANSAVKGGGKIVVAKDNDVHTKQIRVTLNQPLVEDVDFEIDTDGFQDNGEFNPLNGFTRSITRSTDTFFEGGAALDIQFGAPTASNPYQNILRPFSGLVIGRRYTFVAKVLNTSAADARMKIAFYGDHTQLPQKADWQTVVLPFTAAYADAYFGIANLAPVEGTHIYLDSVALYEGDATGFNGESFGYAKFNWMHARVRPVLIVEGMPEQRLGVFVPTAPTEHWDEGGGKQDIELLDRTSIISQDYVPSSYTVKKGTNVIAAVRKVIASTGEPVGAISSSNETVPDDMLWGAGTNKLTIVNELLDSAGFFALWADANGQYRTEQYRSPKDRPVVYELLDDHRSIYIPTLTVDQDYYNVPNRVVMTAQGNGEKEAWTSVATNKNPDSAFSFQRRGRWITDVQLGVEATSQEALDRKATARLNALHSAQLTVEIQHAPVPGLKVNDIVRFRREPADINTRFTVTKTTLNFDPMSLASTTLTAIVDI
jgi:hypothetical protein